MNYNKFVTVVRQICSVNNLPYTSKIVYNKSNYDILYYIYKERSNVLDASSNIVDKTAILDSV
jgi:hypothetical protein